MEIEMVPLCAAHLPQFKRDMQAAFQQGAVDGFGEMEEEILPECDIDRSLQTDGAAAWEAFADGESVGGAIVVIDEQTGRGHLDFLYVRNGVHSKGVGYQIWTFLEQHYPQVRVWETCTPYFEQRNIHFYVNKCGFHIVEFFNARHQDPNDPEAFPANDYFAGMFRFEKVI